MGMVFVSSVTNESKVSPIWPLNTRVDAFIWASSMQAISNAKKHACVTPRLTARLHSEAWVTGYW
jgi:hypothetical protein